jgi:hypothetical protein
MVNIMVRGSNGKLKIGTTPGHILRYRYIILKPAYIVSHPITGLIANDK